MMTNSLFVDTSGWFTLADPKDTYHALAVQIYRTAYSNQSTAIYTTDHVVAEFVALLTARRISRPRVITEVDNVLFDDRIMKLYTDETLLLSAWQLLRQRPDKQWSLADAISFRWMEQLHIREALTDDHHFEQAGLIRLLK